jgi:WD40 repeat protein
MFAMNLAAVLLFFPCIAGAAEPLPGEGSPGTGEPAEPVAFEPRMFELIDVPGLVTGVAVSPDGTLLAVSGGLQRSMGRLTVWNLADGTKRFETKRPEAIRSLAFSPDGQRIVTGDLDHTVRWYETATGRLVAELTGHASGVSSVRFSPDGKRLITGGLYGDVIVWSTSDHQPLTKLPGYQGRGDFSVPISSDGRKIATARREGPVRLWDLESGELLRELVGNVEEFEAMAFSPDGAKFASGGWDGTVTLWNVNNGEVLRQWSEPDDVRIFCMAFAPDGKSLATGTESGLVRIWDVATGELTATLEAGLSDGGSRATTVLSLAFTPDGERLAVGHGDSATTLWDLAEMREVAVFQTEPDPDDPLSTVLAVAYSPDGRRILSLHADRSVRFRDSETGKLRGILKQPEPEIACMALSPDGMLLATGGGAQEISLWQIEAPAPGADGGCEQDASFRATLRSTFAGHTSSVFSLAFSRDGKWLASGGFDQTVRLWSVPDGTEQAVLDGHTGPVRSVAFSSDGRRLASASSDGTVRLWDVKTARPISALEGHDEAVCAVAFSPDGQLLASGSEDRTIRLWDLGLAEATGRAGDVPLRAVLQRHTGAVWSLVFSPQGRTLASGGLDRSCRLWSPTGTQRAAPSFRSPVIAVAFAPDTSSLAIGTYDGQLFLRRARAFERPLAGPSKTIPGPTDTIMAVDISPDGRLLASDDQGHTVTLRHLPSGEVVRQLPEHPVRIRQLAFSPDGTTLAVCLYNGQVLLRDMQTGRTRLTLSGHPAGTRRIDFSPDGAVLATAGWEGTAKLWDSATGQVLHTTPVQPLPLAGIAFSPDGRTVATGSGNWREYRLAGEVKLWDAASGEELVRLGGHPMEIKGLLFDSSGQRVFSYGPNGVRVWDIASRRQQATLAQGITVCTVVLLPDGEHLAIGDLQGGVGIWHAATGRPVQQYTGHQDLVYQLACCPDGKYLASTSKDGALMIWPIEP